MSDTGTGVVAKVTAWLEEHWDPDLTVAEWWEVLGTSGWAVPDWPPEWFGKGLSNEDALAVQKTIIDFGALGAPIAGAGIALAGPTILVHGTQDQKERYLPDIVMGLRAWCQLFSEPGAGSDLASVGTRAVKDGDEWIVNGQKVWTSRGQFADLALLVARTDVEVPKHQGISYFAFEMTQPGVDVRPLREMTGRALFNEVFLTDARVRDDDLIGGAQNGWNVVNTTLFYERAGIGAGAQVGAVAIPGQVFGDLHKRVGDFVTSAHIEPAGPRMGNMTGTLIELARFSGKAADPLVRQDLARLYALNEISHFTNLRIKGGSDIPGIGNITKISSSDIRRLTRELGLRLLGPAGTLHAYDSEAADRLDQELGNPYLGLLTDIALFSPGPSIYGGTDQIQRNIIGERVLGLPKEPDTHKTTAFKDLPRNG